MKRFTETDKWHDPWFRSLSAPAKLVFIYLTDRCNNAGFLELDKEMLVILTKMDEKHVDGALKALSRGMIAADGWIWVRRFLRHQKNEDLNANNPAHKQIIALIKDQLLRFKNCSEFKEFIGPYKGLLSPTGTGLVQVQVKVNKDRAKFVKPTREEVRAYAKEIGHSDPDSWYDHFESNGWKVSGRAQMVDWRAALRSSKNRSFGKRSNQEAPAFQVV